MDHNELEQRRRCFGLNDLHIAILSNDMATFGRVLKCNNKEALQSRDQDGSTALMIAVLCGRLKFVCFLLRQHASTRARDRQGRKALDYSRMSPFIEKKLRIYKALGFHISGVTFREKRRISEMLRYPAALWACRHIGNHPLSRSLIFKRGHELEVLKLAERNVFSTGKKDGDLIAATSGFISSTREPGIKQVAISGWSSNNSRGPMVLDNERYTQLVRDMARFYNFKLRKSRRDNGSCSPLPEHRGRFAACHIEKKLTVWWVEQVMNEVLGTTDITKVADLLDTNLPPRLKEAKLFLDHRPCQDCWRFLFKIYKITGIRVCVETIKFVVEGQRLKASAGCPNCTCDSCLQKREADRPLLRGPTADPGVLDLNDDDLDEELSDGEMPPFDAALEQLRRQLGPQPGQNNIPRELQVTNAPPHWTNFAPGPAEKRPCAKPLAQSTRRNPIMLPESQSPLAPTGSPPPGTKSRGSSIVSTALQSLATSTLNLGRFVFTGSSGAAENTSSIFSERLKKRSGANGHDVGQKADDSSKKKKKSDGTDKGQRQGNMSARNKVTKPQAMRRATKEQKIRRKSVFARAYAQQHGKT